LNPVFQTAVAMDYFFEEQQGEQHDISYSPLSSSDVLTTTTTTTLTSFSLFSQPQLQIS